MKTLLLTIVLTASMVLGADGVLWIPTRIPALRYPALGLQARIEGKVHLQVSVGADGSVSGIKVISGQPVLAKAAQENMKLWKFGSTSNKSAEVGGIDFTYVFKLEGTAVSTPMTDFLYEYPGHVTVTSQPQHWNP